MGSFYAPTCKTDCLQILFKFCKNWISVRNIVHQLTLSLRCKYSRSNFQNAINSIAARPPRGTASQWRQSSMTSFVLSPRTLEHAYRRPFLTVFGEFEPQYVVGHRVDLKMHFLTPQRVFWAISRKIPCTGYFSRRVRRKIKIKKRGLIFHVFRQALPYGRLAQILGYVFVSWT